MKKTILYFIALIVLVVMGGLYIDKKQTLNKLNINEPAFNKLISNSMKDLGLKNYGVAPEFSGLAQWLNSEPLTLAQLKGKVVLVDFWTYSCINCIRTLPYVTGWYEKYKDQGLVVVGVHTPEFAFEKEVSNVQSALQKYNINYPVALDNDYKTWQAYDNHYWPAHYLIDQQGDVVYTHFGEGAYQEMEKNIQQLLDLTEETPMAVDESPRMVKSPEMYFGLNRLANLSDEQTSTPNSQTFVLPATISLNTFALAGQWSFSSEDVKLVDGTGTIKLSFYAQDVHMVASSDQEVDVKVLVDGQYIKTVKIKNSSLYNLYEGDSSQARTLELQIEAAGLKAYTFTFG